MADQPRSVLQKVAPFFFVRDVVTATEYYVNMLGFTQPEYWGDPACFAMPHRDALIVMLSQTDDHSTIRSNNGEEHPDGGPWDAYFWVSDARVLFDRVKVAGARVVYGPVLQELYRNWEFGVRDIDGYLLAFGSDAGQ